MLKAYFFRDFLKSETLIVFFINKMTDKLYYYSGSADKAPGKGSNEHVNNSTMYVQLSSIKDWRKKLSNFWVAPFELDGHDWNTVEHYFQGNKMGLVDPNRTYEFSLDSGSELGSSDGSAAQKKRKMLLLNADQMATWESTKEEIMVKAMRAKFTQNVDLGVLLINTGNAELWHGAPRVPAVRMHSLEQIRTELVNANM